jgi:transglutaminase-like putative cysteine protease
MAIRVALHHRTGYRFDRQVGLGPHEIRLRPAPHCRTPVLGYSFNVSPDTHFLNWQQDPYGNWVARLVFTDPPTSRHVVTTADMTVINPFDFFVEPTPSTSRSATRRRWPELIPFLEASPGPGWPAG